MECVMGVVGRDFAVVAADTSAVQSILVHKTDEDKIMLLDSHKLMGASGEPGDRVQFTEFIQKNLHLYQFRNNMPLSTAATANFTRGELATALRKNPYSVNIILAGFDKDVGASMYYIDYIATLHKIDKGAFGYGSYFCLSLMDKLYRPDMTVEEAVDLVDKCIKEIRLRLVVAPQNFAIKIVDKDGARDYARRESVSDSTKFPPRALQSFRTHIFDLTGGDGMAAEEGAVIACHTKEEFEFHMKKGEVAKKLVIIDFTASWCGPCRIIAPVFAEYAKKFPGAIFLKVDVDELKEVAEAYNVEAMPTFLFIKDGKKVDTVVGGRKDDIHNKIVALMGSPSA